MGLLLATSQCACQHKIVQVRNSRSVRTHDLRYDASGLYYDVRRKHVRSLHCDAYVVQSDLIIFLSSEVIALYVQKCLEDTKNDTCISELDVDHGGRHASDKQEQRAFLTW